MLVLARKGGQTIQIGDRIQVTIVRVDGQRVCIGIDAPRDDRILRGELEGAPAPGSAPRSPAPRRGKRRNSVARPPRGRRLPSRR